MSTLPTCLLLDTNVWLDNYLDVRPSSEESRKLIDLALAHEITLTYPITALKDVHFIIASFLKRAARTEGGMLDAEKAAAINDAAFACVKNMREIATAVGADDSDAWLALQLYSSHRDIEDNMVLAAMERSNAAMLVTNDLQLLHHANCAAMTSANALEYLECLAGM